MYCISVFFCVFASVFYGLKMLLFFVSFWLHKGPAVVIDDTQDEVNEERYVCELYNALGFGGQYWTIVFYHLPAS